MHTVFHFPAKHVGCEYDDHESVKPTMHTDWDPLPRKARGMSIRRRTMDTMMQHLRTFLGSTGKRWPAPSSCHAWRLLLLKLFTPTCRGRRTKRDTYTIITDQSNHTYLNKISLQTRTFEAIKLGGRPSHTVFMNEESGLQQ